MLRSLNRPPPLLIKRGMEVFKIGCIGIDCIGVIRITLKMEEWIYREMVLNSGNNMLLIFCIVYQLTPWLTCTS